MLSANCREPRRRDSAESVSELNGLHVLTCSQCQKNDWIVASKQLLRCGSCRATLRIEDNIVDYFASGNATASNVNEWAQFYGKSLKPYSAAADWWTLACWRRYLFGDVLSDLKGKLILDFGCGTAGRVAALAPIEAHA